MDNDDRLDNTLQPQTTDKYYMLNESVYNAELKHIYEGIQNKNTDVNLHPEYIIQFIILLPIHIPFIDGTVITYISKNENSACTYTFFTSTSTETAMNGVISDKKHKMKSTSSRVEMSYVCEDYVKDQVDKPTTTFLSKIFNFLLVNINYLAEAYQLYTKDVDVYTITNEMLNFAPFYRVIQIKPWYVIGSGMFVLNFNVPYVKKTLTQSQQDLVLNYASGIREEWNPFFSSEKYALSARRNLKYGFYKEAILDSQISVETFLNMLFIELILNDGNSIDVAESKLEETSFIGMVKSKFNPKLGGQWDISNSESHIFEWYKYTYQIRNKILHAGYSPTLDDARRAIYSEGTFRNYVVHLVHKKKKMYPKLSAYLTKPEITHDI